jgi:hypothetical protein
MSSCAGALAAAATRTGSRPGMTSSSKPHSGTSALCSASRETALHATLPLEPSGPQYEVGHLQRIAQIERHLTCCQASSSPAAASGRSASDCISDGAQRGTRRAFLASPGAANSSQFPIPKRHLSRYR